MKTIKVQILTKEEIQDLVREARVKVASLDGKDLSEFGKFCLANAKELQTKYESLLARYSWKDVFYLCEGRPVTIFFEESDYRNPAATETQKNEKSDD